MIARLMFAVTPFLSGPAMKSATITWDHKGLNAFNAYLSCAAR